MGRDYSAVMPSGVLLRFPGRRCTGTVSDTVPQYYTKTVSLADTGVVIGATGFPGDKVFHDDALALFDVGDSDPTNKAGLDALALKVATSYYQWRSVAFDLVYNGVVAPEMNGIIDQCEWAYELGECHTRILTGPYNGDPEELHHNDPTVEECVSTTGMTVGPVPCPEFYGPPASCSGSILLLPRFKLCIVDGRLQATYEFTDQLSS